MTKSAIVAGATGLVGSHLSKLLIQSNEFDDITLLVRKGHDLHIDGASVLEVDYEHLEDFNEYLKTDVVFCCLGTTIKKAGSKANFRTVDFEYPLNLAKLSLRNGSKQFNIITANGANSKSFFFYNRVKGDVEKAIAELSFQNVNIFRPSLLLGERNEKRVGENVGAAIANVVNPLLVGKLKKHQAVKGDVVARSMLRVSLKDLSGVQIIQSDDIQKFGEI